MFKMKNLISGLNLHTICESARCPNIGECFSKKTATFLILGDVCTRNCAFCAVKKGKPTPLDEKEPQSVLKAVQTLGLRYVVITSVTRDDLDDGGASQFAKVVKSVHEHQDHITIEVLIPDFRGSFNALTSVVKSGPHVINHNIETVPRLYRKVRPEAVYNRSLNLLKKVKHIDSRIITKSGLMLGLGETMNEVVDVMNDLRKADCDLITIGQYLQPSSKHYPVFKFVTPEKFFQYKQIGMEMGFAGVASAPLVRSSFRAAELYAETEK
jgi:lipoic acid synthetase